MDLPEFLQQLDRLDKSSPQFPDRLTGFFYGKEYEGCFPGLGDQDVVWLIEYLDNVRPYIAPCLLSAQPV